MNELINIAFENDKEIKALKKSINGGFLELARLLYENKENKYYKTLDYETFESYIAQGELGFKRSSVYALIGIYETFILKYNVQSTGLAEIEWTKLDLIRSLVNEKNIDEWVGKAKELSQSDLQTEIQETKKLPTPPPPKGKYQTIVIDPPWPMEFMQLDNRPNQVEMPYPIMTLDEIKALPINDLATDDCNLFLWTTHRFLPDCFDILKVWGFDYHVTLTWDKTNGRALFGFNRQTEFCLYAHKGKITVNQRGAYIPTIFTEKLREHSRKPEVFYDLIRSNTPEPRLDYFSREKREGFDQYGNETNKWEQTNGIKI